MAYLLTPQLTFSINLGLLRILEQKIGKQFTMYYIHASV